MGHFPYGHEKLTSTSTLDKRKTKANTNRYMPPSGQRSKRTERGSIYQRCGILQLSRSLSSTKVGDHIGDYRHETNQALEHRVSGETGLKDNPRKEQQYQQDTTHQRLGVGPAAKEGQSRDNLDLTSHFLEDPTDSRETEETLLPFYELFKPLTPFTPYVDKYPNLSTVPDHKIGTYNGPIDVEVIRSWIRACDSTHADHCLASYRDEAWAEITTKWFIDVDGCCLVPAQNGQRYVALSYVWGESRSTCTTIANLAQLQQLNALKSSDITVAKTVQNAMQLVQQLGMRYLWVDKLCIVQDDHETKKSQLNGMALIYAGSYLTVMAAQGIEDEEGLYGLFGNPRERQTFITNHDQFVRRAAWQLMGTHWFSRGWTFQENLFARRKLRFHDNTVDWECHCTSWHEDQGVIDRACQQHCKGAQPQSVLGSNYMIWPNMHHFARLVALYNTRKLTFPEDAMDAFAGTLTELKFNFAKGFVSGLPQLCFDAALIWQPFNPLKRRRASVPRHEEPFLPSWSWIGWQGDIHSESWRSAYNYMRKNPDEYGLGGIEDWQPCSWTTISTVKWYYFLRDHRIGRYQEFMRPGIRDGEAEAALEVSDVPERGWSRHWCEETSSLMLASTIISPVHRTNIAGLTRRVQFQIGDKYLNKFASRCAAVDLLDDYGSWAGALRLNCSMEDKEADDCKGLTCELIELSAGSVSNQSSERVSFDEWDRPGCPRHSGVYEFYNVMWIEWIEDAAHRKAVGRVEKAAWARFPTEEITVTLN